MNVRLRPLLGKTAWLAGLLVITAVAAALAVGLLTRQEDPTATIPHGGKSVLDGADKRQLVGYSDYVFFGRVLSNQGYRQPQQHEREVTRTQFKVEVLEIIKGSLTGDVIVEQRAGPMPDGSHYVEDGDALMVPGGVYLIAGRVHKNLNWIGSVPRYGNVRIASDEHRAQLRVEFQRAYSEQTVDPRWGLSYLNQVPPGAPNRD